MKHILIKSIDVVGKQFSIYKMKSDILYKYLVYSDDSLEPVCTLTIYHRIYKQTYQWQLSFSKIHRVYVLCNGNKSITAKTLVLDYLLNYCIT